MMSFTWVYSHVIYPYCITWTYRPDTQQYFMVTCHSISGVTQWLWLLVIIVRGGKNTYYLVISCNPNLFCYSVVCVIYSTVPGLYSHAIHCIHQRLASVFNLFFTCQDITDVFSRQSLLLPHPFRSVLISLCPSVLGVGMTGKYKNKHSHTSHFFLIKCQSIFRYKLQVTCSANVMK